jgi:hypothetical protein
LIHSTDHFTALLEKEKSSKGSLEQVLAEEEKKRIAFEAQAKLLKDTYPFIVNHRASYRQLSSINNQVNQSIESINSLLPPSEEGREGKGYSWETLIVFQK